MKTRKISPFLEMNSSHNKNISINDIFVFRILKMLLQDEIIIFSRASWLKKIKIGTFSIRKLLQKHAFLGICKNAWNFSKDNLSWTWKIRKYSKQSLGITISFWNRKSDINARNVANYSKTVFTILLRMSLNLLSTQLETDYPNF